MIRVIVVDDHPVVCAGMARLISNEDDIEVVATALDGEKAISLDAELLPDVVLMDLSMQPVDGVEATRRIKSGRPAANVLILAATADPPHVLSAIDAGALGFLLKDGDPALISEGIGEKTVKAHLGRVYERIGVTNRADAVAWAVEAELADPAVAAVANEPD